MGTWTSNILSLGSQSSILFLQKAHSQAKAPGIDSIRVLLITSVCSRPGHVQAGSVCSCSMLMCAQAGIIGHAVCSTWLALCTTLHNGQFCQLLDAGTCRLLDADT